MGRRRWRAAAWGALTVVVVAILVAGGARLGVWRALAGDDAEKPWDWVERLGWLTGLLGLPVTVVLGFLALRQHGDPGAPERSSWRLVPMARCRPEEVGVHAGRLTPYVIRDHDRDLRTRLREAAATGGLVVVVGGSSTGKSRSLYEAVRELFGDRHLLLADDAEAVRRAGRALPAGAVVWLDDTPSVRFLGAGGLNRTDLLALMGDDRRGRPVVIIVVLWPGPYRQIASVPQAAELDGAAGDPWRDARQVLGLAGHRVVHVSEHFSAAERARAREALRGHGDPRLADALDSRYGVTQHLAGAPELISHWEHAATLQPYAAAVLTAAVDIRRLDVRAPLTGAMLRAVAPAYLSEDHLAEAPADWFDVALGYATQRLRGGIRALHPLAGSDIGTIAGYELADYLHDHGDDARYYTIVPPPVWEVLPNHLADPEDMARLADAARDRGLYPLARILYRRAGARSEYAARELVDLVEVQGRVEELRQLAAGGNRYAAARVAWLDRRRRETGEAFERMVDNPAVVFTEEDRRALAEMHRHELRRLADAGYEHAQILDDLVRHGRRAEAIAYARRLSDAGDGYAREELVTLLAAERRTAELRELAVRGDGYGCRSFLELVDADRREHEARLLAAAGSEYAGSWLVDHLTAQGREKDLRVLASEGHVYARRWLVEALAEEGRVREALAEATRLVADGDESAAAMVAELLADLGREEELQEQMLAGNPYASGELAVLRAHLGREDDLRVMALAGDGDARFWLAALLAYRGREAELREMAAAGDIEARTSLVGMLLAQGRLDDLRRMAADGDREAAYLLRSRGHRAA
ncbi:hypothetical protein [Couchioplanes caeruleus]|uniref:Tetratricopeptide repeat protein n=2 Tax=Couchioplanes caeruleus TaxID=56438 RepID=A0A1K0H0S6_9ACTN|nr:hypothetical protein [Couchioplanes caeruleus]OJF15291.1 hypothetical protein BG844_05380 [Couchioplanes caeruleus subsp. caeruleus]ROP30814.1 hypothetical protein EDD30_3678 [Couchioplanes caeruleus]